MTHNAFDLVTLAEASRRLGLRNLAQYRVNHPTTFPTPVRTQHPQLWAYTDITDWYHSTITPRRKNTQPNDAA